MSMAMVHPGVHACLGASRVPPAYYGRGGGGPATVQHQTPQVTQPIADAGANLSLMGVGGSVTGTLSGGLLAASIVGLVLVYWWTRDHQG